MKLRFGYNTNGFANHKLHDALQIISDLGYEGVALTLDAHHCHPWEITRQGLSALAKRIERLKLSVVIETGARFLLDPARKHEPTLISPDSQGRLRRLDYLKKAVNIAEALKAEAVSFWSGVRNPSVTEQQAWQWLVVGCGQLIEYAEKRGIQLSFEPEPMMLVDDLKSFDRLKSQCPHPLFGLTLDIGHYFISETEPFPDGFRRYAPLVRNVHIEDIRDRIHEHLPFGEGELPVPNILKTLVQCNYSGLVTVELSRDSHRAPDVAAAAIEHLRTNMPAPR